MNKPEDPIDDTSNEGFIKTPKQLIITVILGFGIPIIVLLLIVKYMTADLSPASGASSALSAEAVSSRIQPVAGFVLVETEDGPRVLLTGEQVYNTTCSSCHGTGVAGAPKFADKDGWAPYIATGYQALLNVALNGKGAMPAKGGNPALSDLEVERAMVYMANAGGASFDEPAEPAADDGDAQATDSKADALAQQAASAPAAEGDKTAVLDPAGEKLYKSICFACHDAGLAGAPKFADKAAWAPYIATGIDTMVEIAIHGKGGMPPRGGSQASDAEIRAAVEYMVHATQ